MWSVHHARRYAAGVGIVLLAGCAGSPSTTPAALDNAVPPAVPASQAQLHTIVLREADLPIGWEGTPYKADPRASAESKVMVKCVGARNTDGHKVAEAHSDTFALGTAVITSSAASYRSVSDVRTDVAMARSPKFSPCFAKQLKRQIATLLPAGATIQATKVKFTPRPAGSPANVVSVGTATVRVRVNGQQVFFYWSTALITSTLIEADVQYFASGTSVPEAVLKSMVAMVAARTAST